MLGGASPSAPRLDRRLREGYEQFLCGKNGWSHGSEVPSNAFSVEIKHPPNPITLDYRAKFTDDLLPDNTFQSTDSTDTDSMTDQRDPDHIDEIVNAVTVNGEKFFSARCGDKNILVPVQTAMQSYTSLVVQFLERVVKWEDVTVNESARVL